MLCEPVSTCAKRYRRPPRYAITLNKRARCRAAFRARQPTTDTPRSRFRKSPRSGSDDTTPGRDCPARFATARNTARSARGSGPLSARARTRFARACSRQACDRNSRSDWRHSRCRRGRAPLAARWRQHNRCDHRSSRGLCGIPLERPHRRDWTACWSSSFWVTGSGLRSGPCVRRRRCMADAGGSPPPPPPPPAAKAGTDGGEAIKTIENMVSVANLIADLIMRTSGFPAENPRSSRSDRPRRTSNIPEENFASGGRAAHSGRTKAMQIIDCWLRPRRARRLEPAKPVTERSWREKWTSQS